MGNGGGQLESNILLVGPLVWNNHALDVAGIVVLFKCLGWGKVGDAIANFKVVDWPKTSPNVATALAAFGH